MENIHKLQHLLDNVSIISKKYDDIARITGENFNIFSIMNMESNERYTHSAIIGELLNPKGSHGQGSKFLKLFFQEIDCLKKIENFNFDAARIIIEEHIGFIDKEYTKGGFIDIVIKDFLNVVIIENKIYAIDQRNQLVRYKNHYPNSTLLYLNLLGDKPSHVSRGSLVCEKDFTIINYKIEITNWLEKCHKESIEQPILRETIKQYSNLVKKLTNQTINDNMSDEIVYLMSKSVKESFEIAKNLWNLKNKLYLDFMKLIINYAEKSNIKVNDSDLNKEDFEYGIYLTPKSWFGTYFNICIVFQSSHYKGFYYGVSYENELLESNKLLMKEKFRLNGFDADDWWIFKYAMNKDWYDNGEIWEDISKGENSTTYREIIEGINKIIEIAEFETQQ